MHYFYFRLYEPMRINLSRDHISSSSAHFLGLLIKPNRLVISFSYQAITQSNRFAGALKRGKNYGGSLFFVFPKTGAGTMGRLLPKVSIIAHYADSILSRAVGYNVFALHHFQFYRVVNNSLVKLRFVKFTPLVG